MITRARLAECEAPAICHYVGGRNAAILLIWLNCEEKLPTFYPFRRRHPVEKDIYISTEKQTEIITTDFLPSRSPLKIPVTSGASCPDAIVESVIRKLVSYYPAYGSGCDGCAVENVIF
jgi:4-hydroxy-3-methylbut-2-enyl diphosphate reductase